MVRKDQQTLLFRIFPRIIGELLRTYFRLEIEGIENVPKRGAALICPNHSGFAGIDAVLLAHILSRDVGRVPRMMAHSFWFSTKAMETAAAKLGFAEASFDNGVASLKKNNMVVIFPEGEHGNFKPSSRMYELQEFKRGFVRMAIQSGAPIVPTLIIGAEETNINLSKLKLPFTKSFIPLPLNVIPLPVKWKIKFLPPIDLPYRPEQVEDKELMMEVATEIQEQMQGTLSEEIQKRGRKIF